MGFAVECTGLHKHYPQFQLKNVNLFLEQGSVMGLVGPNGAGKSTILRMIMGLITPDQGKISVLNYSIPNQQLPAKYQMGFVADDMRLYETETLAFHMAFIKSIFNTWDDTYANRLLARLNLNKNQKIKGLSHGQRVKATLLLALARRPKLLVFDEPTTGLDPAVRKEVLDEMMNALSDETNSILFSSHNTADVEQISDYITFIKDGQIVESNNKEDFIDNWRRLRLLNPNQIQIPNHRNFKSIQQSGRSCTIDVNQFDDSVLDTLAKLGLEVSSIEPLTLEEIFLANVSVPNNHLQQEKSS